MVVKILRFPFQVLSLSIQYQAIYCLCLPIIKYQPLKFPEPKIESSISFNTYECNSLM